MNKTRIFTWITIGTLIMAYFLYERYEKRKIEKDKYETVGKIIDYWIVFPESHYVKYQYEVRGEVFIQETSTNIIFPKCAEKKDCLNRRFVVMCEQDNPENSSIDLNREIK